MRKITIFLLASMMLIISCSGGGEQKKKKIVGAFNDFNDTFLTYVRQAMEEYVNSNYPNYEISFVDGRGDHATLQSALENVAIQEVDGVLINLVNPESAGPIEDIFVKDNIPHLYFNRLPLNLPEDSFYFVGINETKCGSLQAEYVSQFRKSGNAVVLMGVLGNDGVIKRTAGVKEYLESNNSEIKIIREQTGNWQREQGLRIVETWLTANVPIDIVFSNNDEMALGAAQALQQAGKKIGTNEGEVIVCGIDATPDGQNGIKEGSLSMSVLQDSVIQAQKSVDNIVNLIEGKEVPKMDLIEPIVVTKDNAK
ncbi:substrate-binding domain-containing protein [Brachyspira alvinipulli]|uniref:substrate-binding domain-containing protein n=1 Tax=Brachyspira alvinipulli TaxID=84379 RepID=UPI003004D741